MSTHTPIVSTFTAINEKTYWRKTPGTENHSSCNADFDKLRNAIWLLLLVKSRCRIVQLVQLVGGGPVRLAVQKNKTTIISITMDTPRDITHTETFENKAQNIPRDAYIGARIYPNSQRNVARRQDFLCESFQTFKSFQEKKYRSKWKKKRLVQTPKIPNFFANFFVSTYKRTSKFKEPNSLPLFSKIENVEFTEQEI